MEKYLYALRGGRRYLLGLNNVVGVGVGLKEVKGENTGQLGVTVLVRQKLPPDNIPRRHQVPFRLRDVPTDVVEVGDLTLLMSRTDRIRPLVAGISIGHYRGGAGTLGAVVRDRRTGELMILSNNHVLANVTDGADGRASRGDPIRQPGGYDGGTEKDTVARLERFVPLYQGGTGSKAYCPVARRVESVADALVARLHPGYGVHIYRRTARENLVDAALARPLPGVSIQPTILEVGRVQGVAEPRIGMEVLKSGRTTGVTHGKLRVIHASVRVMVSEYEWVIFSEQLVFSAMGAPGDSGSLIVTPEGKAVAMLAAGSDRATIGNDIRRVLELLDVELA
ncbi:MAG TPA: hypothetical protein GX513_07920 [Firmicutes bacterium]|nr:hypothetical protein [Bacillota bacterium]